MPGCSGTKGKLAGTARQLLRLEDEIVLNAIVGLNLQKISLDLQELQGNTDIAYQLPRGLNRREWVRRGFQVWKEWRESSKQRLENGAQFVLFADISAFYENIDLDRLASDLRRLNFEAEPAALLSECLNRWAHPRGKGIPQGYTAADILAKVYLSSVDKNLRNAGFDHLRYVDDVRIFCNTFQQAQRALLTLTDLLRLRGLNIQSAKTYIREADEALTEIDGVGPVISQIHDELLEEIREEAAGAYGTISDLERLAQQNPDDPPMEVLERAFEQYFLQPGVEFDKSLFHFLLTRLGTVKSRIAIEYCLQSLETHPEETEIVARYLGKIGIQNPEHEQFVRFLASEGALYDYQNYQILKFYFDFSLSYPGVLALCRAYVRDVARPHWLRAYAAALLGRTGEAADMEFFEAQYGNCRDDVERASYICSCVAMEPRRRNEFLGRVRRDGDLEDRATRWVRAQGQLERPATVQA